MWDRDHGAGELAGLVGAAGLMLGARSWRERLQGNVYSSLAAASDLTIFAGYQLPNRSIMTGRASGPQCAGVARGSLVHLQLIRSSGDTVA